MQDTSQYFNGTVIITDPTYILNPNNPGDWDKCVRGNKMEALGLDNYATMFSVQPDIVWAVVQPTANEKNPFNHIGKFYVSTGTASVFLLSEVLKYNPDYDIRENVNQQLATIIEHFNGNIKIMYKHEIGPEMATIVGANATNDDLLFYSVPAESSYVES